MPLTRQQRLTTNHAESRILRSGRRPRVLPASRCHLRRQGQVSQRSAPRSPLPVIPGHLDGLAAPERSSRPEAQADALASDIPGRLHVTSRVRRQTLRPQPSDPLEEDSRSVSHSRREATTSHNAITVPETSPPVTAQSLLSSTIDLTDAGAPIDGTWDIVAAHEQRFCFEHWEVEWLLEYAGRWMYPTDFDVDEAETKLNAKFEQYQRGPGDLMSSRCASKAECDYSLWSQVDTPTQRKVVGDTVAYRIRWKLFWTSESSVDDLGFIQSSYKARNEGLGRRQSTRVQDTAASRAAKREEMRIVVDLENWI